MILGYMAKFKLEIDLRYYIKRKVKPVLYRSSSAIDFLSKIVIHSYVFYLNRILKVSPVQKIKSTWNLYI